MTYRGYNIENHQTFYLIHTGGMYGYYEFKTLEEAKAKVDYWLGKPGR